MPFGVTNEDHSAYLTLQIATQLNCADAPALALA